MEGKNIYRQFLSAGRFMNIELMDFIIVGDGYLSFKEDNLF